METLSSIKCKDNGVLSARKYNIYFGLVINIQAIAATNGAVKIQYASSEIDIKHKATKANAVLYNHLIFIDGDNS